MRRNWRWQCLRRAYNGLGKFLSARIAEEAAFVVIHSSYRGELSFGKLSAPLAVASIRGEIDRDGSAEFII